MISDKVLEIFKELFSLINNPSYKDTFFKNIQKVKN